MSVINICSKTINHFKNVLNTSGHKYILISVKGGGCNGLKYNIEPSSDSIEKSDEKMQVKDVPIVICGQSLLYLIGSKFYWETDIMGSSIRVDNPNAKSSCGCGDTFSL